MHSLERGQGSPQCDSKESAVPQSMQALPLGTGVTTDKPKPEPLHLQNECTDNAHFTGCCDYHSGRCVRSPKHRPWHKLRIQ